MISIPQPNECVKLYADLLRKIIYLLTKKTKKRIFLYVEKLFVSPIQFWSIINSQGGTII